MGIWVFEINDISIALYGNAKRDQAETYSRTEAFREMLESGAFPDWSDKTEVALRAAETEEAQTWTSAYEQALKDGAVSQGDRFALVLVPIVETTDTPQV
ncbi:MAG: hypothetical protein ABWZ57_14495 [Mesorhizobium sp.]